MTGSSGNWRDRLLARLRAQYEARFPRSGQAHSRAVRYLVDGGSHPQRLYDPYAFRTVAARGARVHDLDGHDIVDYWQGHYANVLGHNPPVITEPLAEALQDGFGLQTGLPDELEADLAERLLRQTGDERVRFTTAGSLATMYAIMLARAYTGRSLVLKVCGGWHGSQPLAIRGTHYGPQGLVGVDSLGLSQDGPAQILLTRFNDLDALHDVFRQHGDQLACFIVEPCPGNGGFVMGKPEYLRAARELTERHGALLIVDEIITGFRFAASGLQKLYGVQGDLSTYGKTIGGGMPVSAVTGRADVMDLASRKASKRVLFNGGTFSAHPASLFAAKLMLQHMVENEATIYPRLGELGDRLRAGIEEAFARHGVLARCTGHPNEAVAASSLCQVHFPHREDAAIDCPEMVCDPANSDVILREQVLRLGLTLRDVNVSHGLGAVSTAHSEADLQHTLEAFDWVAARIAEARAG
jgi:glutamate-1-semialdehyde 2,1-aminomutase